MSIKEQLEMFQNALDALKKIPHDFQSRYYTDYKKELEGRVYELESQIKYLEKHH